MVHIVDWFTKKRIDINLKDIEIKFFQELSEMKEKYVKEQRIGVLPQIIEKVLKELPADTRAPQTTLYHHLKMTAAIATSWAIEDYCEKPEFVRYAALFHDLGKIRALGKGREHIEETEKILKDIGKNLGIEIDPTLIEAAKRHHRGDGYRGLEPKTHIQSIIAEADSIASGADRRYEIEIVKIDSNRAEVRCSDRIYPHELVTKSGKRIALKWNAHVELWKDEFPVIDTLYGTEISFPRYYTYPQRTVTLLAMDISGIQRYIGESKLLKLVRSGSYLVKKALNEAKRVIETNVCPEAVIYAGGGNLLAVVPRNTGGEIKDKLINTVSEVTGGGLKAYVVYKEFSAGDIATKFSTCVSEMWRVIETKKQKPYEKEEIRVLRSNEVCHLCRNRRGIEEKLLGDETINACYVCSRKIEESEKAKHEERQIIEEIARKRGAKIPKEMDHIGSHIALMVFDGNGIGRIFLQSVTPEEFAVKSEGLKERVRKALKRTLVSLEYDVTKVDDEEYLPYDLLYFGGDDIMLIARSDIALTLAKKLIHEIYNEFKFHEDGRPVVTLSGGIAFGRCTVPIYFLINRAKEMETIAKRKYRDSENSIGSLAYTVVGYESAYPFVFPYDDTSFAYIEKIASFKKHSNMSSIISEVMSLDRNIATKLNYTKYLYARAGARDILKGVAKALDKDNEIEAVEWLVDLWQDDEKYNMIKALWSVIK